MADPPAPHGFAYIHSDIPPGMTIAEWRAARRQRSRSSTPTRHRPVRDQLRRVLSLSHEGRAARRTDGRTRSRA